MPKATAAEVEAGGRAVRVSSPDRVIYEATDRTPEVTKLMVAEYFASVDDGLMRALRERPTALERWPAGVRPEISWRPGGRARRPTRSTRSGSQGRARLPRERRGDVPVRPDRRRDLPDRDRGAGVVRAHGHAHLPPLAGAPVRRGPSRRAADRPRPAARHVVHGRGPRRRGRARAARGARPGRVPQDLGQPGHPHLRPDRAALGVHRPAARRDRVRPRARPPRRGRDHGLVEGGARRADLRGLQPEQPRPHHRLGVLPAPGAGRPGVHSDDLGRAGGRHRPAEYNLFTVPDRLADGDPWASIDDTAYPSNRCCSSGRSCPAGR